MMQWGVFNIARKLENVGKEHDARRT